RELVCDVVVFESRQRRAMLGRRPDDDLRLGFLGPPQTPDINSDEQQKWDQQQRKPPQKYDEDDACEGQNREVNKIADTPAERRRFWWRNHQPSGLLLGAPPFPQALPEFLR